MEMTLKAANWTGDTRPSCYLSCRNYTSFKYYFAYSVLTHTELSSALENLKGLGNVSNFLSMLQMKAGPSRLSTVAVMAGFPSMLRSWQLI